MKLAKILKTSEGAKKAWQTRAKGTVDAVTAHYNFVENTAKLHNGTMSTHDATAKVKGLTAHMNKAGYKKIGMAGSNRHVFRNSAGHTLHLYDKPAGMGKRYVGVRNAPL